MFLWELRVGVPSYYPVSVTPLGSGCGPGESVGGWRGNRVRAGRVTTVTASSGSGVDPVRTGKGVERSADLRPRLHPLHPDGK